jgi:hypothetical protein
MSIYGPYFVDIQGSRRRKLENESIGCGGGGWFGKLMKIAWINPS